MTTEIEDIGIIDYELAPDDQFQVTIDISDWLDTDQISSVAYLAKDADGNTATSQVLDSNKNTNTVTVIKPYIKGGTSGKLYTVRCLITTSDGDKKAFYLRWKCIEKAA